MSDFILASIPKSRLARGLTQSDLARISKTSLATIQNLESGHANPELATLERVLDALGLGLKVQTRFLDWSQLTSLGVPLISNSGRSIRPDKDSLRRALLQIDPEAGMKDLSTRERSALVAWLLAIRDHFYPFWLGSGSHLNSWLKNQKISGAEVKLRRLALSSLAEYL